MPKEKQVIGKLENGNYEVSNTKLLWLLNCTRRLIEHELALLNKPKSATAISL